MSGPTDSQLQPDQAGRSFARPACSALPPKMTWEEIKTNHRDDIKRQAIRFYRSKDTVFAGERPMKRWTLCVQIIVEAWLMLGPQLDNVPGKPICLPSPNK